MKRYNSLYIKVYDIENIRRAHNNARKGKSFYKEVKMVDSNPDAYFTKIQNMLKNKTFKNSEYEIFTKNDSGKEREIFKLPYYPDGIIHHCIVQVLEPIWMKSLIRDTYSSLKNRGIHDGVKRIKRALRNKVETVYCLKFDIKKFYPSINNNILKDIIRKKIKDKDLLWLLDEIIDSTKGVPIGNYLSQYFANLYLSDFDHYMKEVCRCKHYFRYCDDVVILDGDKHVLHVLLEKVQYFLNKSLRLTLKRNYQIFPVDTRGIDFLGYRFYHNKTRIRKTIFKNFLYNTRQSMSHSRSMVSMVMSYYGWFKHSSEMKMFRIFISNKDVIRLSDYICGRLKMRRNPIRRIAYAG